MLELKRLNSGYGRAQVLFDFELTLAAGEVVALLGRNGAGKTTALKSAIGLLPLFSGDVYFNRKKISALESYQIARLGLGYVPEDRRIFADLTVMENLEAGRQAPREHAPHWTPEKLFQLFPNLGRMRERHGGRMSGGEQQMLAIARTLMGNPYLVLLDEPSEGVAPVIVEQMAQMILELKAQGVSILLSEQNMHFAELVSDRAYVLEKGQIVYAAGIDELKANDAIRRRYLAL